MEKYREVHLNTDIKVDEDIDFDEDLDFEDELPVADNAVEEVTEAEADVTTEEDSEE